MYLFADKLFGEIIQTCNQWGFHLKGWVFYTNLLMIESRMQKSYAIIARKNLLFGFEIILTVVGTSADIYSFACSYSSITTTNYYCFSHQSSEKSRTLGKGSQAVYMTNLPFSHCEYDYVAAHRQALIHLKRLHLTALWWVIYLINAMKILGERAWFIQNLILTKARNGIKEVDLDRLVYLYINERILNCSIRNTSTKKKLQYTHGLEMQGEDMVNLEELILREEAGIHGEVIDVDSDDEDKKEDDDMEILGARPWEPKRARLE